MTHYVEQCACGAVLSQCRCASKDKPVRVRPGPCRCKKPASERTLADRIGPSETIHLPADSKKT